jgi:hypothetical protein
MELESAAEREAGVHSHAHHVASAQLGCGCPANIGLKRDVVYKISGELETIAKNQHAATQDAQLHDFILEAVSAGNPQVSEVSLGDLHFSGETIVGRANLTVQSACPLASTAITGCRRASSRTEASASASGACCAISEALAPASGACCAIVSEETAEKAAIDIAVRSFFICWLRCLLFMAGRSRLRSPPATA